MQWIFGFNKTAVLAKQTDAFHPRFQEFAILATFRNSDVKILQNVQEIIMQIALVIFGGGD